MQSCVEFEYLYRDASNYKFWNSVVFADPSAMNLDEVEERIRNSLDSRELLIACQVRLPNTFPYINSTPTEDDHCFHEFASVRQTKKAPDDRHARSVASFVQEVETAARRGWRVFDPRYIVQ